MGWTVYLQDTTARPWCSYGTPPEQFVPTYPGDEVCPEPCYPSVSVDRHTEGGTYVVGGTTEAELAVTYNYGGSIRRAWPEDPNPGESDILGRLLNGVRAADAVPLLELLVERLGTKRARDYWASTDGNAGHALSILLWWAKQHPNAVFKVS